MNVRERYNTQAIQLECSKSIGAVVDFCGPLLIGLGIDRVVGGGGVVLALSLRGERGHRPAKYSLVLRQGEYLLRSATGDFFVRSRKEFLEYWAIVPDDGDKI